MYNFNTINGAKNWAVSYHNHIKHILYLMILIWLLRQNQLVIKITIEIIDWNTSLISVTFYYNGTNFPFSEYIRSMFVVMWHPSKHTTLFQRYNSVVDVQKTLLQHRNYVACLLGYILKPTTMLSKMYFFIDRLSSKFKSGRWALKSCLTVKV